MNNKLKLLFLFLFMIINLDLISQTQECNINKLALEYCLKQTTYKKLFLVDKKHIFYVDKYNSGLLTEKMIKYFLPDIIDSLISVMENIKDSNPSFANCEKKIKLISIKKSLRFMEKSRHIDLSNFKKYPLWKRTFFKITPIIYYKDYAIVQCWSIVGSLNSVLRILLFKKVEGQYKVIDELYSAAS